MNTRTVLNFRFICGWNGVYLQVVQSATSGSGSSVCGVAPGSYSSKELHYVLRTLTPAACRNHLVFTEVARNILRINLVTLPKRGMNRRIIFCGAFRFIFPVLFHMRSCGGNCLAAVCISHQLCCAVMPVTQVHFLLRHIL